jgi:hypothetical protein
MDPANNSDQIAMTVERRYISSEVMKRLCCAEPWNKSEAASESCLNLFLCAFASSLRLCVKLIFHAKPQRLKQRRKEAN